MRKKNLKREEISQILDQSEYLKEVGKVKEAINLLEGELKNSLNIEFLSKLANLYVVAGDTAGYERSALKIEDLDPKFPGLFLNQVRHFLSIKQVSKAFEIIHLNSEYFETNLDGLVVHGLGLKLQGDSHSAEKKFLKVLKKDRENINAQINLGLLALEKGKYQESLEYLIKCFGLKPHQKSIWPLIIAVLDRLGNYNIAFQVLLAITDKYSDDPQYIQKLGICALKVGEPNVAEVCRDKLQQDIINHTSMKVLDAKIEEYHLRYKNALAIYESLLDVNKNSPSVLKALLGLYLKMENHQKAKQIFNKYTEISPKDKSLDIRLISAGIDANLGQYKIAVEKLIQILEKDLNHSIAWEDLYHYLSVLEQQNFNISYFMQKLGALATNSVADLNLKTLSLKLNQFSNSAEAFWKSYSKHVTPTAGNNDKANIISLRHFGRSGSGLLHTLIDNHSEVSTLPSIFLSEFFDKTELSIMTDLSISHLSQYIITRYPLLFDSSKKIGNPTKSGRYVQSLSETEGLVTLGDQRNMALKVDTKIFSVEFTRLLSAANRTDPKTIFIAFHRAYDFASKGLNWDPEERKIFYHIHNPSICALATFTSIFRDSKNMVIVREPIQSCESYIRLSYEAGDLSTCQLKIARMLTMIAHPCNDASETFGMKLEDLKSNPKLEMEQFCKWASIKFEDTLLSSTVLGNIWWGDPTSVDYKPNSDPFDTTPIKRRLGYIFSERDISRLATLFYPFYVNFSYALPLDYDHQRSLKEFAAIINEPFDFESKIYISKGTPPENIKSNSTYQYLRYVMHRRCEQLSSLNTYPHLLKPYVADQPRQML